ncbi:RNA polymerase sigma factor [Streptomyces sp. NPDC048297]|uniref:RNA polymerase sigma factor n=1 Tax=Streptomyces sp. NPDC048297 TaxID=3365531 RepID=UPI00371143F3
MRTQDTVDAAALVSAARQGDPAAQDALVGAYLPLVYNIVGRALNGSVDVDDVVQETMLRALDALPRLRAPESFRSWLVAIAVNQVRTYWHDRQLAPGTVEDATDLADPGADFVDLTMTQLQLSGQRQETARATRRLEPDDRALLSLWWLECAGELTRPEVAVALELSPQHTAVRVQRMKAQLEAARVVVRALDARPRCEELRGVLAGWDGRPSALWRKRIARHARGCPRCAGLWSGLMPAEGLLAGLALVAATPALLAKTRSATGGTAVTGSTSASASAFDAPAGQAASGPAGSGAGGGHRAPRGRRAASRGEARRRRRIRRRAVGGAVVAACVAGGGLWYFGPFGVDPGAGGEDTTAARSADEPLTDHSSPDSATATRPASTSASSSSSASPPASASEKAKAARPPSPRRRPRRHPGRPLGQPRPLPSRRSRHRRTPSPRWSRS